MCAADKDLEPIVEEAHTQPVPDQTGRYSVEHLAQGEAACTRYRDDHLFEVRRAPIGELLQMSSFGIDALAMCRIAAANDLINEGTVGVEIVEVPATAHQESVADSALEMTMGTFDRAVLVRDALVVACRCHAVVVAQLLIAVRKIGFCVGTEITESRRQAVAAVIER